MLQGREDSGSVPGRSTITGGMGPWLQIIGKLQTDLHADGRVDLAD